MYTRTTAYYVDVEAPPPRLKKSHGQIKIKFRILWAAVLLLLIPSSIALLPQNSDELVLKPDDASSRGPLIEDSTSAPLEYEDPRTFNVVVNYRVEGRIVAINDYGNTERIFGHSNRLVDVAIGEVVLSNQHSITIHDVNEKSALLTIQSTAPTSVCDYEHNFDVTMHGEFGATNGFQSVTTCGNDGMTYSILAQVAIVENRHFRTPSGRAYDISLMSHVIKHHHDILDGWQRIESSETYKVRHLGSGEMTSDPLESEYKTAALVEDGKSE